MTILGISAFYHDSAAALMRDGEIVAAAQEERFTRVKHDARFPFEAIGSVLAQANLNLAEVDAVVFFEKPFLKFDRILESYLHCAPWGRGFFVKSFSSWIQKNLFSRRELRKSLRSLEAGFDPGKIFFSDHHLSHAASAFFPSPFAAATVLTLDGVGEWATMSVAVGQGSDLQIKKEIHFPHSLGFFYSMLTTFCGFKVNSGEYKLMGLAPYGEPRFAERMLKEMITVDDDGAISLNLEYFDFLSGSRMHSRKVEGFFQVPPREPESPMQDVYFDIAASAQTVLETVLLKIVEAVHREYPSENLCLAGGVALNCVANSRILKQGPFKNLWIQPAAGDAGGSLGAALAYHHLHLKRPRSVSASDQMRGALLGPEFSAVTIENILRAEEFVFESHPTQKILQITANELAQGKSVGWFQGRMEFGPRALGSRSILADARREGTQKRLNLQIKFRESFRPFAPAVLAEDVKDWFDFEGRSPYMLLVADVRGAKIPPRAEQLHQPPIERLKLIESPLPAVTHIDGSARLQTVHESTHPHLHALLSEFKEQTGCGALVNTSFNVRGEPIVHSPYDALRCFMGTDLDLLVMGDYLVYKEKNLSKKAEYHARFPLD